MSDLTEMFKRFNRAYFAGRKPRYRVLRRQLRSDGYSDATRRLILIRRGLDGDELAAILLHEMCHIGCPGHGPRFRDRVRRLIAVVPASVARQAIAHRLRLLVIVLLCRSPVPLPIRRAPRHPPDLATSVQSVTSHGSSVLAV